MLPSPFEPAPGIRVADEIEQPAKERQALAAPQPEGGCAGSESICEGPRVVEDAVDSVGDHMGHRLRVHDRILESDLFGDLHRVHPLADIRP